MKWDELVNWSMINHIELYILKVLGRPTKKSVFIHTENCATKFPILIHDRLTILTHGHIIHNVILHPSPLIVFFHVSVHFVAPVWIKLSTWGSRMHLRILNTPSSLRITSLASSCNTFSLRLYLLIFLKTKDIASTWAKSHPSLVTYNLIKLLAKAFTCLDNDHLNTFNHSKLSMLTDLCLNISATTLALLEWYKIEMLFCWSILSIFSISSIGI